MNNMNCRSLQMVKINQNYFCFFKEHKISKVYLYDKEENYFSFNNININYCEVWIAIYEIMSTNKLPFLSIPCYLTEQYSKINAF